MAEELGTWPPEQATVLLEVLQKAGIKADAKRTKDGVIVTVPDDQADEAHQQLVANMDAIARAARRERPKPSARKVRPVKGADHPSDRDRQREMASDRVKGVFKPLGLILVALLLLGTVGRANPLLAILMVGALVYFIGKRAQQGDGGFGSDGGFGRGRP